jgi:Fic family protein
MVYIWEEPSWPHFTWDDRRLLEPLAAARLKQGRLLGTMARLGFDLKRNAQLEALTEDVVKSSEIEGEVLDRESVRSSIARRLGVPDAAVVPADRRTEGVVEMMLDATQNYDAPLGPERLFGWQAALFPTGYSGFHKVKTGTWRDDVNGPMQVVSEPIGRQRIHYQAPPAERLEAEMQQFLNWFNRRQPEGLLRAGLAHLWFVTVHPFEDGNGRVARAIADQALAQSEGSGQRFYSMSSQIRKEQFDYYRALERSQKGTLDVSNWLVWFLGCFSRAVDGAETTCGDVLRKAEFWQRYAREVFSERQKAILNRFLDGFEGKLTAKKWALIGKCSIPTAQRDINDLVERSILRRNPGGSKNTSYDLAIAA